MYHFDNDHPMPEVPFDTIDSMQKVLDTAGIDIELEDLSPEELLAKALAYNVYAHVLNLVHDADGDEPTRSTILIPVNHRWSTPIAAALNWQDRRVGVCDADDQRETLAIAQLMGFRNHYLPSFLGDLLMGFMITDDLANPQYNDSPEGFSYKVDDFFKVIEPAFGGGRILNFTDAHSRSGDTDSFEVRIASIGYALDRVPGTGSFFRAGRRDRHLVG